MEGNNSGRHVSLLGYERKKFYSIGPFVLKMGVRRKDRERECVVKKFGRVRERERERKGV